MTIIKCKMCGGDIQLADDKTFGTCEYCGSTMTFPKVSDEQRAAAFNRGNHFRRIGEFDKALAVYERIVAEDEADAEAHWCCALCRFGIEYVEDPATYEWLPTCHRMSFDSFLEDPDYQAALEHSEGITRRQYQKDAAKIAEVQRGILATSQNAEPYDVFLSYKELDANGSRTRDSILAQDIYYQLTEKGWRVFFSRVSLEDVPGTEYEPYIFAALNSAKVMVVVGTSAENLNAVWVKNEWSRYLSLMRRDRSRLLIPCYRDMDPYDLPEQLSVLMSYDMGKIGFIQDLIRGIDKGLGAEKPKETAPAPVQERVIVQQTGGGPNMTAMIERGHQALEDGDFDKAEDFFNQALNMDAKCAEAFLGLALAGSRSRDAEEYIRVKCERRPEVKTVPVPRDEKRFREVTKELEVPGYLKQEELLALFPADGSFKRTLPGQKTVSAAVRQAFLADRNMSRAFRYASGETQQKLEELKNGLEARLTALEQAAEKADQAAEAKAKALLASAAADAEKNARWRSSNAKAKREAAYQEACKRLSEAKSAEECIQAAEQFAVLKDYKDSKEKKHEAEGKAADFQWAEQAAIARARAAAEKKQKKKRLIAVGAALLVLAVILLVTMVIIPSNHYKQAEALAAEGKMAQAALAYNQAGSYSDAKEKSRALWDQIAQRDTISAGFHHTVGLKADGTVVAVGENDYGQCDVSGWTNIVAIAAGDLHTVGLKADGTVIAVGPVGFNDSGQCDVSDWTDVVAVSAGLFHTVGLKADGTVLAVGRNREGQCGVSGWTDIVAIAASDYHTVGLKADGTVVATKYIGEYYKGQCDISDWNNIVAVAAGGSHTVGLRADGTVVAVGSNDEGQCNVSGWTDIVAVAAGNLHTVGLKADGTVIAVGPVGINDSGQCDVSDWTDVVAVSAGLFHTVGLKADGTVLAVGLNKNDQCDVSGWKGIKLPKS